MKITLDDDSPFWIAQANLDGHPVALRLESDDETASDAAHTGQRMLAHVQSNWDLIQRSLVNDLLAVHNEEWADASGNRPILSPSDFLQKLIPSTIDYGTWEEEDGVNELCSVLFHDSNIFGGHAIQVLWNPAVIPISPLATIEG